MRKLYLLVIILLAGSVVFAQSRKYMQETKPVRHQTTKVFDEKVNQVDHKTKVTYLEEGFEGSENLPSGWTVIDQDGDGNDWYVVTGDATDAHTGVSNITSASWAGDPLTPENYLVTPAIDLTSAGNTVILDYFVYGQDPDWADEHYEVIVATGASYSDISSGDVVLDETISASDTYLARTIDLSGYSGQTIYIAFLHNEVTDMFRINLDDIKVYEPAEIIDLAVTGLELDSDDCNLSDEQRLIMTLKNVGGMEITDNIEIDISINDGAQVSNTTIMEDLSLNEEYVMEIGPFDMSVFGEYDVEVTATVADDANAENDSFSETFVSTDGTITLELLTDYWSSETGWEVIDNGGNVVASMPFGSYESNTAYTENICVMADGCYSFIMYDEYGDGMVSSTGNGTFAVYFNGVRIDTLLDPEFGSMYAVYNIGNGCPDTDASLVDLTFPSFVLVDTDMDITGVVQNLGNEILTSFDIVYSIDGGDDVTYSVTGLDLETGEAYEFTHGTPANIGTPGTYTVEVSITNVNGGTDENLENNAMEGIFAIVTTVPQKRVVGEEATGTWCGWCVRGHVYMDYMAETYPDTWIGIAVHNSDPMVVTDYDEAIGGLIPGYPSGLVDRVGVWDPSQFELAYEVLIEVIPPVDVSITNVSFDETSREVSFDVEGLFVADIVADLRFNAVVMENHVKGSTSGYDQANYYSGGDYGPMGGYEDLSDPVPAEDMVYENVARAILGGWDGTEGSIPATIATDDVHSQSYSYTLPEEYNESEIELIGMVIDQQSGIIVNAAKAGLIVDGIIEDNAAAAIKLFPNPVNEILYIHNMNNVDRIIISNVLGQTITTLTNVDKNAQINTADLNNGIYIITFVDESNNAQSMRIFKR